MTANLILASASPRRRELLTQLCVSFDVIPADIDERVHEGELPDNYVRRLSFEKAEAVKSESEKSAMATGVTVFLAADTTVVHRGEILGKPRSRDEAIEMLSSMSGATHEVITGVSVVSAGRCDTFHESSKVTFRALSADEIEYYWQTGEPVDKAGSYGLQGMGAAFVESITGSHTNVIGLPLSQTVEVLRMHGISCLDTGHAGEKELKVVQGNQDG